MAQQVLIWARLHNHHVVTVDVVDAVMSRDKDTEQGKANPVTVRRIIRKRAASELVRVIFTREERYWAIRERLHQMTHADVIALADSISDGGDADPRGWDKELTDAITAYRSNRPAPARVRGCKPVAVPLWKDPAPAVVEDAPAVDPYKALYASLSAADMDSIVYDVTAARDGVEQECPEQEGKRMALAVAIKHSDGARVEGTAELFTVDWRGVKNGPGDIVFIYCRRSTAWPVGMEAARDASGLSLNDLVEVAGHKVKTENGWDYVPAWYGHLRDVWASDGQIVARVEGPEGEPAAPLLSDLRPVRWHMRTVNGGTPERIPSLDALREINNAMAGRGREGVREMSESAGTAQIVYRDVRGEVWLRPATSAEIATEQKPERERYAEGDRVIVRGTFYRPENRRTYDLPEYEGTVTNWTGSHFNVRAVKPDEDGTTYGVRPCAVRELRPVPPTVDDVADVPHDLYLSGELRHQGVTAEWVRKIVKNLRGKRAVFFQDPADRAIVTQNTRYVPQLPVPEPATDPIPREWSETDVRRARGFAAKWRAETVHAEPRVTAAPTDEALAECFAHTVRPLDPELYPLVRHELAGWDARIAAEDARRPENIPAVSPAPLFTALAAYEATNDTVMKPTALDLERLARHLLSMAPGAPSPERRALVTAHYALEAAAKSLRAAAERRGKPGQLQVVNAARQQADEAIGAAREAVLVVQPHAERIRPTDIPVSVETIRAAARAYLAVTGTPEELAAVEDGTPTVQVWCSADKKTGDDCTARITAGISSELGHIPAHPPVVIKFRRLDRRQGAAANARKVLTSKRLVVGENVSVEFINDLSV
ncbi:hypothetical protein [Streptomyces anulatus]|uniref:hypothetical protein n=1 Tax=Streptomyces anulatus TaxID=1892 RepID=UPI003865A275|nr:hypothetical protein OHB50_38880 [Streptomyces anulatus]